MPRKTRETSLIVTPDQLGEAAAPFIQVAAALTPEQANYCVGNKTGVRKRLMATVNRFPVTVQRGEIAGKISFDSAFDLDEIVSEWIEQWAKYYRDILGIATNFKNLIIPPYQQGFDRLGIMARGIFANGHYEGCQKQFRCYRYKDNLDEIYSDRLPVSDNYAFWMENLIEPREEYGTKSANDLMEIGFKGIALPERLADEGEYYFRTKSHRDIENITRCDASRGSVGYVPGVYWLLAHAEFNVFWYDPDSRSVDLRSRPVSC